MATPKSYTDWLEALAPGYASRFASDSRLQQAYQSYAQNINRVPDYGDSSTMASFFDTMASKPDQGYGDPVQDLLDYATTSQNLGAQRFGFGTPLTLEQHNQLKAQLNAIPNLPDDFKQQVLSIPQEGWKDPQIVNVLNSAASRISANPDSAAEAGGNYGIVTQISQNGFGLPGGKPLSDLFNPVQNVGAAHAGMAAVGAGAGSLIGEGVGAGLGLGDVAAVPAGEIGGGGAAGIGFGTTGEELGTAPELLGGPSGVTGSEATNASFGGPGLTEVTPGAVGVGEAGSLGIGGAAVPAGAATGVGAAGAAGGGSGAAASGAGAGLSPGAATAGAVAGGTALSRILDGTATTADILSVLGGAGATGLGIFGALDQQRALSDLANKLYSAGAPSRARFESSMTPGFDPTSIPGYQGAVDTSSEAILRKLSATQGNPYGSPGGLIEANKAIIGGTALPAVQAYQNQNAAAGGFAGFANQFPSTATGAAGAQGNVFNAIGSGLSNLTNPPPNYSGLLNKLFGGLA